MHPLRKLLVLGTNHLIEHGKIHRDPKIPMADQGHCFTDIARRRSVVLWNDIGWDELRISVWWDFDRHLHPQIFGTGEADTETFTCTTPLANRHRFKQFVGVVVSGWLERRKGFHLQGNAGEALFDIYVRRGNAMPLRYLPDPAPMGFGVEGKVFI